MYNIVYRAYMIGRVIYIVEIDLLTNKRKFIIGG